MRIWLIEPYCEGSHRAWAEGYAAHSRHQVTLFTLPARFWKWRMQGGALTLAEQTRASLERPDALLASDMLNLPAFLGLTRSFLADLPAALYCHENQLTYPTPPGEKRDLTYAMINWLSMLTAERIFFNSQYHLKAWFDELPRLLSHFPDYTHLHRIAEVRARAQVLPVGCDLRRFDTGGAEEEERLQSFVPEGAPLVLWNQRWEYDKDPDTFLRALLTLADEGLDFRVALAGQSYRQSAPEFDAARERLGARVVHFGFADEACYRALLRRADVVVSTALHEFFGVAIVEAISCGCFPLLPRRLAYPELIPPTFHAACLYDSFEGLVERLGWGLAESGRARRAAADLRPAVDHFDWARVAPRYDDALAAITRP
jgi:glycosyltransferase involved in cell wall biosynthesis